MDPIRPAGGLRARGEAADMSFVAVVVKPTGNIFSTDTSSPACPAWREMSSHFASSALQFNTGPASYQTPLVPTTAFFESLNRSEFGDFAKIDFFSAKFSTSGTSMSRTIREEGQQCPGAAGYASA